MGAAPEVGTVAPSRRKTLEDLLQKAIPLLNQVAAKHMNPERMARVALLAASRHPELLMCEPKTIVRGVMQAAEMGLEIGDGFGHCYLVPFKNGQANDRLDAQLIVGYQGYIELALRTGKVLDVRAVNVFKCDEFNYEEGTKPFIHHKPDLDGDRVWEQLRATYAVAILPGGIQKFDIINFAQIEKIRARSKTRDKGPWNTDALEMARKSPVRRLQKYLPKTREIAQAIALDEADEGLTLPAGLFESLRVFDEELDTAPKSGTDGLKDRLRRTGTPETADQAGRLAEDHGGA